MTRRRRFVLVLMGLALLAAGCASDAPLDTLDPRGPEARTIDDLLHVFSFHPLKWIDPARSMENIGFNFFEGFFRHGSSPLKISRRVRGPGTSTPTCRTGRR